MSAIKFGTDGWRAIIGVDFTLDNLTRVTEATALWLKDQSPNPTVMIGYDCRFNGQIFAEAVANVMAQNGIRAFLSTGFASTPMVSLATFKRQCTAGIVITASHNPAEYSGFKIKGGFGGPATPSMITAIESRIPESSKRYEDQLAALIAAGKVAYYDMESVYLNHIKETFDLKAINSSGIKVGYDAMFGAGQRIPLKVIPAVSQLHCEFNPSFQGTPPEPILRNLGEFQALIRAKGLHFGLATDGDADRIGLMDENGDFVDSNHIILLLIQYLSKHKPELTGKVVYTFSCTSRIAKLCKHYNLPSTVTKIGFKYICDIMLAENVLVGGEESGGIAVAGHIPERDGIYIGLMILEMMAKSGKKLTELIQEVYAITGPFAYDRNDLHISEAEKQAIIRLCKENSLKKFGNLEVLKVEDMDGYKFHLAGDQWVMIRPSGTEPVLRIYAEAGTQEDVELLLKSTISTLLNQVKAKA